MARFISTTHCATGKSAGFALANLQPERESHNVKIRFELLGYARARLGKPDPNEIGPFPWPEEIWVDDVFWANIGQD